MQQDLKERVLLAFDEKYDGAIVGDIEHALSDLPDEARQRIPETIESLKKDDFLTSTWVQKGPFRIDGHILSTQGERAVDQLQGYDTDRIEANAKEAILRKAFKEENGILPYKTDLKNIGPERRVTLFNDLAQQGMLQGNVDVQVSLFKISGGFKMTEGARRTYQP